MAQAMFKQREYSHLLFCTLRTATTYSKYRILKMPRQTSNLHRGNLVTIPFSGNITRFHQKCTINFTGSIIYFISNMVIFTGDVSPAVPDQSQQHSWSHRLTARFEKLGIKTLSRPSSVQEETSFLLFNSTDQQQYSKSYWSNLKLKTYIIKFLFDIQPSQFTFLIWLLLYQKLQITLLFLTDWLAGRFYTLCFINGISELI